MKNLTYLFLFLTLPAYGKIVERPLDELLNSKQFFENISNPVLKTRAQILEHADRFRILIEEFKRYKDSIKDRKPENRYLFNKIDTVVLLLQRFLSYADSNDSNQVFTVANTDQRILITFEGTLKDSLRKRLTEWIISSFNEIKSKWDSKLGIEGKNGYYYVKIFSDIQSMQKKCNLPGDTRGVAFPCRYIAVAPLYDSQGRIIESQFKTTVEHEFVHLFCFELLGFFGISQFPTWFHEGIAIELSGVSNDYHVSMGLTGMTVTRISLTDEYLRYQKYIQFVKEKEGEKRLYALMRNALLSGDLNNFFRGDIRKQSGDWFEYRKKFHREMAVYFVAGMILIWLIVRTNYIRYFLYFILFTSVIASASISRFYSNQNPMLKYLVILFFLFITALYIIESILIYRKSRVCIARGAEFEKVCKFRRSIVWYEKSLNRIKDRLAFEVFTSKYITLIENKLKELERMYIVKMLGLIKEAELNEDFARSFSLYRRLMVLIRYNPEAKEGIRKHEAIQSKFLM